jgi:alkylation response protein AidB-like acyl-CoA dehydrogenase
VLSSLTSKAAPAVQCVAAGRLSLTRHEARLPYLQVGEQALIQRERAIFSDEHTWFRDSVSTFIEREITPRESDIREGRQIPRDIWTVAGASGFLGLGVAERYGGSGTADFRFNAVLQEELAAAGMAYASCIGIHTDVVAPYLTELTTDDQRERWLPGFCDGSRVTAIAMTEPEAGSDLAALRTRAERRDGGWALTGSKTFITNGLSADLVIVAARTDRGPASQGITLFVVERDMPGFVRGRKLEKIGQHQADTAELFFEDVFVPDENVLGRVGRGFVHMMERLPQERLSAACANIAHAAAALRRTLEYVRDRRAFGRPIGTFQANRFALAEMTTLIDVTRAYVDQCLMAHVDGGLSDVDAAKAKWWTADVQNSVIDQCVQLFGGYGYMSEYDVARAWADARVTRIWAGSNEIMKEVIGRSLGLAHEPR